MMPTAYQFDHLAQYLSQQCQTWKVPGLALLAAHNGEIIFQHMHGYRDVANHLPVTAHTVFGVASVTKSVTALAVMQAQDQGALTVNDRILDWLPELGSIQNPYINEVTIHHLLSHTAGFPGLPAVNLARVNSVRRDPDWPILLDGLPNPFDVEPIATVEELMQVMVRLNFKFLGPPSTVFNYSNESFALLQGILERATRQPYVDFMQENLFTPLDMRTAVFCTDDLENLPEVTELYAYEKKNEDGSPGHSPAWWDVGKIFANGALKASPADLIRYLEVYRTGGVVNGQRIVSGDGLEQMTTRHIELPTGLGYGYGLHVDDHHGTRTLAHSGGIKGVSSAILVAPEKGLTVVALVNTAGVPVGAWTTAVLNAVMGLPLTAKTVEYAASTGTVVDVSPYVGVYSSDEGDSVEIVKVGECLAVQSRGQITQLQPYAADGFVDTGGTPICFLRREDGAIEAVFTGVRILSKRR